jgi:hypothetical protein
MSSAAQINANRANSQSSSGPKTEAGKARSSHNAVKSALTGQTVALPTDDVPAYLNLVQSLIDLHHPITLEENFLVQSLADTEWRLQRIPTLESGLYALGRRELSDLHSECADPQLRENLIETEIYLKFERNLKNLSLQEARLLRRRAKDLARLLQIQAERKEAQEAAKKPTPEKTVAASAAALFNEAQAAAANPPLDLAALGFEFSTQQFAAYFATLTAARKQQLLQEALKGGSAASTCTKGEQTTQQTAA